MTNATTNSSLHLRNNSHCFVDLFVEVIDLIVTLLLLIAAEPPKSGAGSTSTPTSPIPLGLQGVTSTSEDLCSLGK